MDVILYSIRDGLVGTHYFIYAFILSILMFSIIGYLFKQKYAKFDIKLETSQSEAKKKKDANNKVKPVTTEKVVTTNQTVKSQNPIPQPNPNLNKVVTPTPMPNKSNQVVNPTPVNNNQNAKTMVAIPEIK